MLLFKPSLKSCLSQNGFTSSENYDYVVQCFLANPVERLRCLHIDGNCGRRRSAFAHALSGAIQSSQVIYHEFGIEKVIPRVIRIHEGEEIIDEPPIDDFDRVLTEACAQSEAEKTVLILDQLHKSIFQNHVRLFEFIQNGLWRYSDVQFQANKLNLLVFLISDEPLYHSLQSASFRLWVNDANESKANISASDIGLDTANVLWFLPLQKLLGHLCLRPTIDQYQRLAYDIIEHVLSRQQLKLSLFGWLENIDKQCLDDSDTAPLLDDVLKAILLSKGIDEEIEISSV